MAWVRIFSGKTRYEQIVDGAEIIFEANEPSQPFRYGWEISVEMPDASREVFFAEPDHGPTHVGWRSPAGGYWIFPLVSVGDGRWRVQVDEQHRFLRTADVTRGS